MVFVVGMLVGALLSVTTVYTLDTYFKPGQSFNQPTQKKPVVERFLKV
jgi:hypothetical protein